VTAVLGAVVIVGPEIREEKDGGATTHDGTPLVCAEVLGRSVVGRTIESLRRAGFETISVLGNISGAPSGDGMDFATKIDLCSTEEAWLGATRQLLTYKEQGSVAALVIRAAVYVDFDVKEAFQFHCEQGAVATRAFDKDGPLDVWIIDPAGVAEGVDMLTTLAGAESHYQVTGYVNRLEHPRDLRRLAVDGLTRRCGLRPRGNETRPGVWIDEGAQVHRDSRIVAPAFIGRESRIAEQCLITRCSSIESNSHVDYGTVVEDSSVLSNSYVGIGLDLSHSIVDGNRLLNLERDVILEVSDPRVIRENRAQRGEKARQSPVLLGVGDARFVPAEEGSH
jgi:NDP-sugar pyrophosphorylase family protein